MMNQETKRFYVGVRPCGCMTAALVADLAADNDVALFTAEMRDTGRKTELRELTHEQFNATFQPCECDVGHNAQVKPNCSA